MDDDKSRSCVDRAEGAEEACFLGAVVQAQEDSLGLEDGWDVGCRFSVGGSFVGSGEPFILPCCGGFVVVYSNLINMPLCTISAHREANVTLTDEASYELLLLYGCADAALQVALVEHDSRLWCVIGSCRILEFWTEKVP